MTLQSNLKISGSAVAPNGGRFVRTVQAPRNTVTEDEGGDRGGLRSPGVTRERIERAEHRQHITHMWMRSSTLAVRWTRPSRIRSQKQSEEFSQRGLFDRRMMDGGRFVHQKQMPLIPHALPHNPRALLSDGAIKLARQPFQGEASCTPIWRSAPVGEEADHVDWSQMWREKNEWQGSGF